MQGNLSAHSQPSGGAESPASPLVFTKLLFREQTPDLFRENPSLVLALTADERTKSKHYFEAQPDSSPRQQTQIDPHHAPEQAPTQGIYLGLPRGTILHHGDRLTTEQGSAVLRIIAKPESVMTAIAPNPLMLLKAAYHLGNRHVALEVSTHYLRFSPDPVLKNMVEQMGLTVRHEQMPFHPEAGAYANHSTHSHHSH